MSVAGRAIRAADHLLGARLLAAQKRRQAGVIVLYHRVSTGPDAAYPPLHPAQFQAHCEILKRSFSILPLGEMVERHRRGLPLGGCCAITFDDGYGDFLEHAHPILQRMSLPATHFLVLQSVLEGRPNWNWRANRLAQAAHGRRDVPHSFEVLGRLSGLEMVGHLGRWEAARRNDWLQEAEDALSQNHRLAPEPRMLRAPDLAQCDASLISWGSHTVSHAMLGWCEPAALRHELADSRLELGRITGRDVDFLSYPNSSFSQAAIAEARSAGYSAALAVGQSEVSWTSPLMALPRFDIGWMDASRLRLEVCGAEAARSALLGRRWVMKWLVAKSRRKGASRGLGGHKARRSHE